MKIFIICLSLFGLTLTLSLLSLIKRYCNRLRKIRLAENVPLEELLKRYESVKEQVGAGHFKEYVSVQGEVVPLNDNILRSESDKNDVKCVYYELRKTVRERWRKRILQENVSIVSFGLQQNALAIPVMPQGAKIEPVKLSELTNRGGVEIKSGKELDNHYITEEWCIPVGSNVLIVGEVNDRCGELVMSLPVDFRLPFIIYCGSRDDLVKHLRWQRNFVSILAGVLFLVSLLGFIAVKN